MSALPRTVWALAIGLGLLNGFAAFLAERTTAYAGLAGEGATAAEVLAGAWDRHPQAADVEAARKKLALRPGFRALVVVGADGHAFGDRSLVPAAAAAAGDAGYAWRGGASELVGGVAPLGAPAVVARTGSGAALHTGHGAPAAAGDPPADGAAHGRKEGAEPESANEGGSPFSRPRPGTGGGKPLAPAKRDEGPRGWVFVGFDAAPAHAAELGALTWAARVALTWLLALLAAAGLFHLWWNRRVAALAEACAGPEPEGPPTGMRAGVYELDGLADVFTVMAAVRRDAGARRARARFAAERDRGEPELLEAYVAELAPGDGGAVAGRPVAAGATAGAAGTFAVAIATPTGGCALAARIRGAAGLRLAVEADGARRLVAARLAAGATPAETWAALTALWPVDAWDLATWDASGAPPARWTLEPGASAPAPVPVAAAPVTVLGTFPAAMQADMAAYGARLGSLSPAALRDDLLALVAGDEPGTLVVLA